MQARGLSQKCSKQAHGNFDHYARSLLFGCLMLGYLRVGSKRFIQVRDELALVKIEAMLRDSFRHRHHTLCLLCRFDGCNYSKYVERRRSEESRVGKECVSTCRSR